MSSEFNAVFTKDNLDTYLQALAREFRRINGSAMPAEIILIGGAAIIANYGFREMTTDIDAIIQAASSMKDAINFVGDKYNLPNGWLNDDFKRTVSYSHKLLQVSDHYKTFSKILEIRTISAEFLIAMKLRSGRKYKNDLSDIIGILAEHENMKKSIKMEDINMAVKKLYGGWSEIPHDSKEFIDNVYRNGNYAEVFTTVAEEEKRAKGILLQFEEKYPNVTTESNADDILSLLKSKLDNNPKE